ncbi:hypothetical protein ACRAWD_02835 [Caulobacter segnis]
MSRSWLTTLHPGADPSLNAGQATVEGAEPEVAWRPLPWLNLSANYEPAPHRLRQLRHPRRGR